MLIELQGGGVKEMLEHKIGCCYFPTTILFVDDNLGYLRSLRTRLDKTLIYDFYTDPNLALEFLKNKYHPTRYVDKWVADLKDSTTELGYELEQNELTHSYIDIDVSAIHKEIYDPDRFNEVSLLVVDYAMPTLNGIEFCKKLEGHPVKKLMLTGQAGYDLGVNALNDKIIDKFLIKDTADFRETLNSAIAELQHQYFYDLSSTVIGNLTITPRCCLNDPTFINFFNKVCKDRNIVEYYLVSDTGSMLLIYIDGAPVWFIVENESALDEYYDLVSSTDDPPAEIVNALKNREKIPFFSAKEDSFINSAEDWTRWKKHLHHASKLEGEKNCYYYAFIESTTIPIVNADKITSYKEYLRKT